MRHSYVLPAEFNACPLHALQVKLAISHALAQSTKLCVYEERVVETVLETKHLPETLAKHGNVHISRKKVAQLIGAQHAASLGARVQREHGAAVCTAGARAGHACMCLGVKMP